MPCHSPGAVARIDKAWTRSSHQVAERVIHQPLALDPRLAGEGRRFRSEREMAFAGGVVAAVAAMLLAVVDQLDAAWGKRRVQPPQHFSRDRAGGGSVHRAYIGRLDEARK